MKVKIKYYFFAFVIIVIVIASVAGVVSLTTNTPEPFWFELDTLLYCNNLISPQKNIHIDSTSPLYKKYKLVSFAKSLDNLKSYYDSLHKESPDVEDFSELICKPFVPTWEYNKIFKYLNPLLKKKSIVISGVTGAGKTTVVERLAKFITGSEKRIKTLACTERMEVEYHREWIGYWTPQGYQKGKLLAYFEQCLSDPNHNYAFILDDFDKIYPSTFFGSELWEEMDSPGEKHYIEGYGEIQLPENFYMISVTHEGVSNVVILNDEHFRRMGTPYQLDADYKEFLLNIIERTQKKKLSLPVEHIKKLIYFFFEINQLIIQNYGKDYTLGQWSTLKSYLHPADFDKFVNAFIEHVNSFKPHKELASVDLSGFYYTVETDGSSKDTYPLLNFYNMLIATGLFSEVTVAIGAAIISGLFGWFYLKRKKKLLDDFQFEIISIAEDFKNNNLSYDSALEQMVAKKLKLEDLILKKKIKYEEITFLLLFIDDQMKKIEESHKMNFVTQEFYKTFDEYTMDGILDDDEFKKLNKFLENMRPALSPEIYYNLKNKITEMKEKS